MKKTRKVRKTGIVYHRKRICYNQIVHFRRLYTILFYRSFLVYINYEKRRGKGQVE